MGNKRRRRLFLWAFIGVMLVSAGAFTLCYRYDNKYYLPRPQSGQGETRLNMDWYDSNPFFYLIDGWEFYQGRLLSPGEFGNAGPDAHLYIGRYGGFDLGDPEASPHGQGTYRTVIQTDGRERDYALELTDLYSSWRLWVNGVLVQSVGMGDPTPPAPDSRMAVFTASGPIEIVAEVTDDRGFYSGMVYPPAFGSPERVGRVLSARLILHSGACAMAVLIFLLCLLARLGFRVARPYTALAALCICFWGASAWPLFQALGLRGELWPLLERLCNYAGYLALIWIQGQVCKLPRRATVPAYLAGGLVCLSLLIQPLVPVTRAAPLMAYANCLAAYKWLTALWLVGTSLWALRKRVRYSRTFLMGSGIFSMSLVMGKLLPMHEPVLLGWFTEMAGAVLILMIAGLAWYDAMRIYKISIVLREKKRLAEVQLRARAEQARLQQEYVRRTRAQLHESRNRLTLIRHYAETRELEKLEDYLDGLVPAVSGTGPRMYTGHGLIDAILTVQLSRAAGLGIYVEWDLDPLPAELPISDDDLTSLLMNLLDNAVEGCERIEDAAERWIALEIRKRGPSLKIECRNAALPPADSAPTSKPDKRAHGFGLPLLRQIAAQYGGAAEISRMEDSFCVVLTMRIEPA